MRLLLDTCAVLWLAGSPARLGRRFTDAVALPNIQLFLSDCSVWELCLKWNAGKIGLPEPPRRWVESQKRIWGLESLAMERSHLYRVTELPDHHRDPFDRLLVAQAIEEGLTLATPDPEIAKYPVAVIW